MAEAPPVPTYKFEGGFQLKDFLDRLHVPAVAQLAKAVDGGDVGTPLGDADQILPGAYGAKNRGSAGCEGNDAETRGA
jgi:hypothetical protein